MIYDIYIYTQTYRHVCVCVLCGLKVVKVFLHTGI